MKICMISFSVYQMDGRVHRYGSALVRAGHEVDVIGLGMDDEIETSNHGAKVYQVQKIASKDKAHSSYIKEVARFFLKAFFLVTRLHWRRRYDIIHYHNMPDFGVFCTLVPKLLGAKIILDIHDIVPELYARKFRVGDNHPVVRILRLVERASSAYADSVITVTEIWRRKLVERSVRTHKCTVVMNTAFPELFDGAKARPVVPRADQRFTLLYHGTLDELFGVDIAIRAVALVAQRVPSVLFLIYGMGRQEQNLRRLVAELGIEEYVVFNKPIPRSEIPEVIRDVDLGIVPKRADAFADEALSSKLLELIYMNKPVVVSRTRASQTYFDDQMLMYFEPENHIDLARCVVELWENRERRETLSANTIRFVQEHNWQKYEREYLNLLGRLAS